MKTFAEVWATFAAAVMTPVASRCGLPVCEPSSTGAEMADEMLKEFKKRFPDFENDFLDGGDEW